MQTIETADLIDVFRKILIQAKENGIVLVAIRYKPIDPEYAYSGDYDFLIPPSQTDRFFRIVFTIATRCGISFTIDTRKYAKTLLTLYDSFTQKSIVLELWNLLDIKASNVCKYIPYESLMPYIQATPQGHRLDPVVEATYYITHLRTKQKELTDPLVRLRLGHYANLLKENGENELYTLFNDLLNTPENFQKLFSAALERLRRYDLIRTRSDITCMSYELFIRLRSFFRKRLVAYLRFFATVALVGPDGVGKTTIIQSIQTLHPKKIRYFRFKKLFRHSILYKLLTFFKSKSFRSMEKNRFDDAHATLLFCIAAIRYPFFLLAATFKRKLYLIDRFFYDLLMQGVRSFDSDVRFHSRAKQLLRCIQPPPILLHLDAPVSTIHARKKELSTHAIQAYRQNIFESYLLHRPPFYCYLNTVATKERCGDIVVLALESFGFIKHSRVLPSSTSFQADVLARGNERICYIHPHDPTKVFKVTHKRHRNQNLLDRLYYAYLQKKKKDLSQIATCYGEETIAGMRGVSFERIRNYDGSFSLTFPKALEEGKITAEEGCRLLQELWRYLERNTVLFVDVGLDNLMLQEYKNGAYRLVIVDGLGARRPNWKFKLYLYFPLYARYKLKTQRDTLLENYRRFQGIPCT